MSLSKLLHIIIFPRMLFHLKERMKEVGQKKVKKDRKTCLALALVRTINRNRRLYDCLMIDLKWPYK